VGAFFLALKQERYVVAGKQYEVVREFQQTDPKTGVVTNYKVGDAYTGPTDLPYLLDPSGPDGNGPLIAEKSSSSSASDSSGKASSDSSGKEK
jgi:hypothetical protein